MSNNDSSGALGGCIGILILLWIALTIIAYTIQIALIVMGIVAAGASLWGIVIGIKNFVHIFREAHREVNSREARTDPIKFIFPKYTLQPARLMYFYDAGWFVIQFIALNVWKPTTKEAHRFYQWGLNFINDGKYHFSGNFFKKLWSAVRYYAPGLGLLIGWLFHFIAASLVVATFIASQLIFLLTGVLVTSVLTVFLGIGTTLYGRFYRIYYRCPNCHDQMDIPVHICPTCSTQHTKLWPSVYGVTHHTCLGVQNGNLCSEQLPALSFIGRDKLISRCPSCDHQLGGLGGTNAHIPIIGSTGAGKSCYIFSAAQQLIDEYAPKNSLVVTLPDSEHQKRYEANVNNYLKLGRFVPKTPPSDDGAKALNLELKTVNQAVPNLLYFYDAAGEDFSQDEQAQQQKFFKYVDGVVLIIDPFSLPQFRQEYADKLLDQSDIAVSDEQDLDALFSRILSLFETRKTSKMNRQFSQPVTVILTKVDIFDLEDKIGDSGAQRFIQENPGKAHNEQDARNILVEEFLNSYGADNFLRSLHQYFSNVRFFSCSIVRNQTSDNRVLDCSRALDPLLWMLEKANMLPNKAALIDRVVRSKSWIRFAIPTIILGIMSSLITAGYFIIRLTINFIQHQFPTQQQTIQNGKFESMSNPLELISNNSQSNNLSIPIKFNISGITIINPTSYVINTSPSRQVNVYSQPSFSSHSPHYGLGGDKVIALKRFEDSSGYIWYYVRFPSLAEGWLPGDILVANNSSENIVKSNVSPPIVISTNNLTKEGASQVIAKWLYTKKVIFAPPYNLSALDSTTTGTLRADLLKPGSSVNWLSRNNAYYVFRVQTVDTIDRFVINGNQAIVNAKISEDRTLYKNGRIDPNETDYKTRTVQYSLDFVGGSWKISDYRVLN